MYMQFSETLGNIKLKKQLINSVQHNRIAHAQMFFGEKSREFGDEQFQHFTNAALSMKKLRATPAQMATTWKHTFQCLQNQRLTTWSCSSVSEISGCQNE